MDSRGRTIVDREQRNRFRKGEIRMADPQHRARSILGSLGEDYRRRQRPPELARVFGVGEERQITDAGSLDAGHAMDFDLAVAFETALETLRDFLELQCRKY